MGLQRRALLATAVSVVVGGIAAPAWASPNTTQYNNPSAKTPTVVKPQGAAKAVQPAAARKTKTPSTAPLATSKVKPGSLPFTGLDLALSGLLGVALVAVGLTLRRVNRTVDTR